MKDGLMKWALQWEVILHKPHMCQAWKVDFSDTYLKLCPHKSLSLGKHQRNSWLLKYSTIVKMSIPSVGLSAIPSSSPFSSGFVTTMDVRGVTNLYISERARAWAVRFSFSSPVAVMLNTGRDSQHQWLLNYSPNFRLNILLQSEVMCLQVIYQ